MLNGCYGGHFTDTVAVAPVKPDHPICRPLAGKTLKSTTKSTCSGNLRSEEVEIIMRPGPVENERPASGPGDYPVSWIRSYGKGRVFYCSLGHCGGVYATPEVMQHYLAGIQWAIGD